jgi:hypothetical protein
LGGIGFSLCVALFENTMGQAMALCGLQAALDRYAKRNEDFVLVVASGGTVALLGDVYTPA